MKNVAPELEPEHGNERNRRMETDYGPARVLVNATTREPIYVGPMISHTRSVLERWCAGCQCWIVIDGFMAILMFEHEHSPHPHGENEDATPHV